MEDAVARRGVVRLLDAMELGKLPPYRGLLVVVFFSGEDEVIVGDGGLPRKDRTAARDLIEGVNRKWCGAVGCGEQVGIHAQRGAGGNAGIFIDAMRPHDLRG